MAWYPIYGPKRLFRFVEQRSIVCYCTHEQKMNCKGFTQNGFYDNGNQPQPFEVGLIGLTPILPALSQKQDLTVN